MTHFPLAALGAAYVPRTDALSSSVMLGSKPPQALAPALRAPARIAAAGHGWTGTGTSDDTAMTWLGDRSLKIAPAASSTTTAASPTFTAQDWSKGAVRVLLRVDDYAKLNFVVVQVTTGAGNVFTSGGLNNYFTGHLAGEWMVFVLPRGTFTVNSGTPTWAGVTQVQLLVSSAAAGGVMVNTHGIDLVPDLAATYPNGVFILEADDGYASQKNLLIPLADSLGVPVTLPLIIERITDTSAGMTVADLKALQRNGHQLACHAYSSAFHSNAASTAAAAEADLILQQRWYDDNGLSFGALDMALCPGMGSPLASADPKSDVLRRRFRSVRVNSGYYESAAPSDPYAVRSLLYAGDTNVLTTHINRQAVPGGAFMFAMHGIVAGATNGTDNGLPAPAYNNLKAALQLAASNGMAFRTRADWLAGR
jgi:hypothetical protein